MARIEYDEVAADYRAARGLSEDGLAGWKKALNPYFQGLMLPVLDVGSGAGQFATLFPKWFGASVIGVEPSEGMRARAEADRSDSRVTYLAGDAEHLPLADRSCGAAWLSTVIHHVPDLAAAAREIRRVVVPGGPLVIRSAFPGRTSQISLFRFFPEAAAVVETFPTVEQVERHFGAAGFALLKVAAVPQVSVPSLEEFRARVALRADTTLRGISNEAFEAGLTRLDQAIRAGGNDGPFVDYLDMLVLR